MERKRPVGTKSHQNESIFRSNGTKYFALTGFRSDGPLIWLAVLYVAGWMVDYVQRRTKPSRNRTQCGITSLIKARCCCRTKSRTYRLGVWIMSVVAPVN